MSETSRRDALRLSAAAGAAVLGTAFVQNRPAVAQESSSDVSFEEIDRGIREHAKQLDARPKLSEPVPAGVKDDICQYWRPIRPIIVAVSELPLIPPSWRAALRAFIAIMDQICGS